jgi:hypothetical protein
MKRTTGGLHVSEATDPATYFIRDNGLAQEIDNKPVITSKGEQFLDELRGASSK